MQPFLSTLLVLFLLLLSPPASHSEEQSAVIIHQNDLHGWLFPAGNRNGLGEMAKLLEDLFREEPSSFYAMAGDLFTGPDLPAAQKGKMETELWNAFWRHMSEKGFGERVIWSLGNHEFDYGVPDPSSFASPPLCANLVHPQQGAVYRPYQVIETDEGLRVGWIGLLLERNRRVLQEVEKAGLTFLPMREAVGRALQEMGRLDLTVLLIHDHLDAIKAFARDLPPEWGIDIILAGHDHLVLEEPVDAAGIPVSEAGAMNRFYGRVDLLLSAGEVKRLESRIVPWGPDLLTHSTMRVKESFEASRGEVVAFLERSLTGSYLREQESSLGNFVTDAFRWATGTDIAMTNGSSLRLDFPIYYDQPLELREGDMKDITPFRNALVTGKLTGAQLLQILEGEAEDLQNQISGIRYSVNMKNPPGKRVEEVSVNGEPLLPGEWYTLTHNAYCADPKNMQRYLHLPPESLVWKMTPWKDYEALIGYARHLGTIDYPTEGEGRIERRF